MAIVDEHVQRYQEEQRRLFMLSHDPVNDGYSDSLPPEPPDSHQHASHKNLPPLDTTAHDDGRQVAPAISFNMVDDWDLPTPMYGHERTNAYLQGSSAMAGEVGEAEEPTPVGAPALFKDMMWSGQSHDVTVQQLEMHDQQLEDQSQQPFGLGTGLSPWPTYQRTHSLDHGPYSGDQWGMSDATF